MRYALFGGDHVQALVHAVDEVNIGIARRSEHDSGALGQAARGMGGDVGEAQIGFGFYYHAGGFSVQQHAAKQGWGELVGRAVEEIAGERNSVLQQLPLVQFVSERHSK